VQARQQAVQHRQLARGGHQRLHVLAPRLRLAAHAQLLLQHQQRVRAQQPQRHAEVAHAAHHLPARGGAAAAAAARHSRIQHLRVVQQRGAVEARLALRERAEDSELRLGGDVEAHLRLAAAQPERAQRGAAALEERGVDAVRLAGEAEACVEGGRGREHVAVLQVQQAPQLVQVVLQQRAREQQAAGAAQAANRRRLLRELVLHPVPLI